MRKRRNYELLSSHPVVRVRVSEDTWPSSKQELIDWSFQCLRWIRTLTLQLKLSRPSIISDIVDWWRRLNDRLMTPYSYVMYILDSTLPVTVRKLNFPYIIYLFLIIPRCCCYYSRILRRWVSHVEKIRSILVTYQRIVTIFRWNFFYVSQCR